jgi:predicted acetyltransferase
MKTSIGSSAGGVTLQLATREQETPLANLLELYLHDMSETFPIRISEQGRFGYAWLPTYWAEPEIRSAYLIHSESGLSGFVLTTLGSPASQHPAAIDVAEFFVLRRFRRTGVGRAAMHQLWDQRPGHWVVRVSEGNSGGRAFWGRVVREYGEGVSERSIPGRHYPWRVYELDTGPRSQQPQI